MFSPLPWGEPWKPHVRQCGSQRHKAVTPGKLGSLQQNLGANHYLQLNAQGWVAVGYSEAHYRGLQRRAAICGDGVTVLTNLCTLGKVEVVDKHKWLTVVHAPLMVEAGERCDGLATCD